MRIFFEEGAGFAIKLINPLEKVDNLCLIFEPLVGLDNMESAVNILVELVLKEDECVVSYLHVIFFLEVLHLFLVFKC